MKTINIKETVKTPSAALQYMVDGLRNHHKRIDFKVDMDTFGRPLWNVCYGCAATCTIQQIAGKNLTTDFVGGTDRRAYQLNLDCNEMDYFEDAINSARSGSLRALFYFFDLQQNWNQSFDERFFLDNHNWFRKLHKVEELITELKMKGL